MAITIDFTDPKRPIVLSLGASSAVAVAAAIRAEDAALDARKSFRKVTTYGDRASIPLSERSTGMLVKVVQAVDEGGGNYRPLWFTLDAGDLTNSGWKVAPEFAQNWVAFASPPIFDSGTLYIPGFYVLGYESNGYGTYYGPSSGAAYVASAGSTGNNIRRHIFDKAAFAAGASLEDAIIEVDDTALPLRDTHNQVVLAVSRNGRLIDTRDATMGGDLPGGAVPNQFAYGREVDNAAFIFPGAAPADLTDADLLAAGFTRGIRGAANSTVTYGGYEARPLAAGEFAVFRFRLYAETAGTFGQPQIHIYTSDTAINAPIVPSLFRQINANTREYYWAGKLAFGGNGKWAVGSNNSANAARVWVVGAQFWRGNSLALWITTGDFPAPADAAPLMANELWLTSDRPLPLFAANGLADRTMEATAEIATIPTLDADSGNTPKDAVPQSGQPYFDTARADGVIWLDPAELAGQSLALTMRAQAAAHAIISRVLAVNVRQVPLSAPVNIKVGLFGDSHSASYFPRYLKTLLAAWNINVTFYGTLETTLGDKAGETREFGEGRGGWGLANMFGTYQLIGGAGSANVWDQVLGSGSIAAYTGGDFNTRQRTNPFLNNGSSGSSAPVVAGALPLLGGGTASGFRLDLVNYRTRFGLPSDLDFVLWSIGGSGLIHRSQRCAALPRCEGEVALLRDAMVAAELGEGKLCGDHRKLAIRIEVPERCQLRLIDPCWHVGAVAAVDLVRGGKADGSRREVPLLIERYVVARLACRRLPEVDRAGHLGRAFDHGEVCGSCCALKGAIGLPAAILHLRGDLAGLCPDRPNPKAGIGRVIAAQAGQRHKGIAAPAIVGQPLLDAIIGCRVREKLDQAIPIDRQRGNAIRAAL